jgi:hypothetical protein
MASIDHTALTALNNKTQIPKNVTNCYNPRVPPIRRCVLVRLRLSPTKRTHRMTRPMSPHQGWRDANLGSIAKEQSSFMRSFPHVVS